MTFHPDLKSDNSLSYSLKRMKPCLSSEQTFTTVTEHVRHDASGSGKKTTDGQGGQVFVSDNVRLSTRREGTCLCHSNNVRQGRVNNIGRRVKYLWGERCGYTSEVIIILLICPSPLVA